MNERQWFLQLSKTDFLQFLHSPRKVFQNAYTDYTTYIGRGLEVDYRLDTVPFRKVLLQAGWYGVWFLKSGMKSD